MRFAYADPPYLGTSSFGAQHHYGDRHAAAADYDTLDAHRTLIDRLTDEYPDGWVLSLHTPSLRLLLPLCPPDVRVMAWCKSFASFKPGVNPAYTWEPLIVRGGRKRGRNLPTLRDFIVEPITLRKGLTGAKPENVCRWIFGVLNAQPQDTFDDLFPGTGVVSDVWRRWCDELLLDGDVA